MGVRDRDGDVVTDDLSGDHHHRLADDRIDLPGHDRRTRLHGGQVQLAQPRTRSRAHPPEVVRDLQEADRDRPEGPARLEEGVLRPLRLEMVLGKPESDTCRGTQPLNNLPGCAAFSSDATQSARLCA